jgi:hypothetical protein
MKKILVILALAVASFANAQKGSVLVMGSISYWSQKNSYSDGNTTVNNFGFSPKAGYQFADNWTLGGEAAFSFQNNGYVNQERKRNEYSAGAFIRYSKSLSDLFLIYADFGTGYTGFKETGSYDFVDMDDYTNKANGFYAKIAPAVAINIKKGFALNFGFGGLEYYSRNIDNGNKESNFYFNFGQSFTAGVSKNF